MRVIFKLSLVVAAVWGILYFVGGFAGASAAYREASINRDIAARMEGLDAASDMERAMIFADLREKWDEAGRLRAVYSGGVGE